MSRNTLENAPVKTLLKNANGFGKIESDSLERCNVGGLGVKDKLQPQTMLMHDLHMLPSYAYNVSGL